MLILFNTNSIVIVDIIPTLLHQKFGLKMPHPDKSTLIYYPQLFLAMQYHTHTRWSDIPFKNFGKPGVADPLSIRDLLMCDIEYIKDQYNKTHLPGELGRIDDSGEALLANGYYAESLPIFQLRLYYQQLLYSFPSSSCSMEVTTTIANTVYKLALAQYGCKEYDNASKTLRQFLDQLDKYNTITGQLLTLLMCVEFSAGRDHNATVYYDAAQEILSYTHGPHHPVIAVLMCALGDKFYSVEAIKQSKVMIMLAHFSIKKSLGINHVVYGAYVNKLGAIAVFERDYSVAIKYLNRALTVFENALAAGSNVEYDTIRCLYNLTLSYYNCGEYEQGIRSGLRCKELIDVAISTRASLLNVSCLLLVADLLVKCNSMDGAFKMLHEAWEALRIRARKQTDVAELLPIIIKKSFETFLISMPMQLRSLFETVASEVAIGGHGNSQPGMWDKAVQLVIASVWSMKPTDYFIKVIRGMESSMTGTGNI